MLEWLRNLGRRRAEALSFERDVTVTDHGEFVTSQFPNGSTQSLSWRDLERVEIRTNDSGPWGADVWWVLIGKRDECSFPQGATGEPELFSKLQNLPTFDNAQFIEAMKSTGNATFICWQSGNVA